VIAKVVAHEEKYWAEDAPLSEDDVDETAEQAWVAN
jgi:hypothetical protein